MASVQWEPREPQPDTPVVSPRLWRGVAFGLVLVAPFWYAVLRLIGWV